MYADTKFTMVEHSAIGFVNTVHKTCLCDNNQKKCAPYGDANRRPLCLRFPVISVKSNAQLMPTNPRDAFRGQSKSPNMVPFDMTGMVYY